ncbi:MAG TPA: AraC family transcriptional regulator [Nocardioidaceae bacterium]|nr:AraC family transcriptional regulator [Nocardioidaceae bacterium]
MRSEYAWLPPADTVTTTKPYQVGVSFSAHSRVAYERDGRATYLDVPAGVTFANGQYDVRWAEVSEPTEALEIYPDRDLLRSVTESAGVVEIQPVVAAWDATVLSTAALLKRVHVGGTDLEPMQAGALAHRLAVHLADHYCSPRPRHRRRAGRLDRALVDRIRDLVDARLGEPLGLDDLAAEAGFSAFHFARAFKRSTGLAPHEFVTMRRMERAKAMLLAGRGSVADIAYAVGYANVGHFRRQFRRYTGFAPSDLRAA